LCTHMKKIFDFAQKNAAIIILAIASSPTRAQTPEHPATPPPNTPAQQPASVLPPVQLNSNDVLHHLNQIIGWYRHSTSGIKDVGLPSDAIYQDNARTLGAQAVRLAFDSAKAESTTMAGQQKNDSDQGSGQPNQQQNLEQLKAKTSAKIDQLQSQIDSIGTQLTKARSSQRVTLTLQRDAVQSELDLQKAILDAIQRMSAFVESSGESGHGMEADINRLAQSIPEVLGRSGPDKARMTKSAVRSPLVNTGGLIGQAATLYEYMSAMHQIDKVINETNYTGEICDKLRSPLRDAMRATIRKSEHLAGQSDVTDTQQSQGYGRETSRHSG